MSVPADKAQLDTCGCCEDDLPAATHENPPGQTELAYRIGRHSSFLRRMLVRLPRWQIPDGGNKDLQPLSKLTTRSSDDPAIALLDAWATVGDVLTFYQERIANEGFLATVKERRSVLELARAIGYELSPGVAAETYLAFTVDDTQGAPEKVTIGEGTQVQSIPKAQGELPQTFETAEEFVALADWNELRPRLTAPQTITLRSPKLTLQGADLNLQSGDRLLLVAPDQQKLRAVRSVEPDAENEVTVVRLEGLPSGIGTPEIFKSGDAALPLSGGSSINFSVGPLAGTTAGTATTGTTGTQPTTAFIGSLVFNADNVKHLLLDQVLTESELQATLAENQWEGDDVSDFIATEPRPTDTGGIEVFALREKAGIFGHNAPLYLSLPQQLRPVVPAEIQGGLALIPIGDGPDGGGATIVVDDRDDGGGNGNGDDGDVGGSKIAYPHNWDGAGGWEICRDSLSAAYYAETQGADLFLERVVPDIAKNSWLVLEMPDGGPFFFRVKNTIEVSLTGFGLSAKVTGLNLANGDPLFKDDKLKVRRTTAYVRSEKLALAEVPITDALSAGTDELELDSQVLGLQIGQTVIISGEQADAPGVTHSEVLRLRQILHSAGRTTLRFTAGLQYSYLRETVTLYANAVRTTHGETVAGEVLGNGDSSQPNQSFFLRRPPLTFVSAAVAGGAASTLSLRVNGLAWEQAPSLYGLDSDSQRFITRLNNEGETAISFGDGKSGARLPTGQENIVATYRSGIGAEGEVGAGSLTLLKTRPFGVRSVINPTPATGSDDPETLENARENAPLTVLTLDRIVSLLDFEDFTRAFAGIGKARAIAMWDGERQVVHITIAGPDGARIDGDSSLFQNLFAAIDAARDPLQEVRLGSYQKLFFSVQAKVLSDPAYRFADVKSQIEAALLAEFGFDQRAFGQSVTAAEVVSTIHSVAGVKAVDLDGLAQSTGSDGAVAVTLATILPGLTARPVGNTGVILPAQLLLINSAGIALTEITE